MITAPFQKRSDTSRAAAESVEDVVATQKEKVFNFIKNGPCTDYAIATTLKMQVSSATARRRALVIDGRVRDSGKRVKGHAGRDVTLWEIGSQETEVYVSRETLQKRIAKAALMLNSVHSRQPMHWADTFIIQEAENILLGRV